MHFYLSLLVLFSNLLFSAEFQRGSQDELVSTNLVSESNGDDLFVSSENKKTNSSFQDPHFSPEARRDEEVAARTKSTMTDNDRLLNIEDAKLIHDAVAGIRSKLDLCSQNYDYNLVLEIYQDLEVVLQLFRRANPEWKSEVALIILQSLLKDGSSLRLKDKNTFAYRKSSDSLENTHSQFGNFYDSNNLENVELAVVFTIASFLKDLNLEIEVVEGIYPHSLVININRLQNIRNLIIKDSSGSEKAILDILHFYENKKSVDGILIKGPKAINFKYLMFIGYDLDHLINENEMCFLLDFPNFSFLIEKKDYVGINLYSDTFYDLRID